MKTRQSKIINGIDTEAVRSLMRSAEDPAHARTRWHVATQWQGGTRSDTRVTHYEFAGERIEKDFTIRVDEPLELGGTNEFANPQETLLAAMNACMTAHYVIAAAAEGVELEDLRIETEGDIDLRGFLGIDPDVKPGYDSLRYRVHIRGDGTPKQMEKIHATVTRYSPNRFNLANAIRLEGELVVE